MCKWIEQLGVAAPTVAAKPADPTPQQVFNALEAFPEYRCTVRRRTRKPPGKEEQQSINLDLRLEDGSYAMEINLLRVTGDDQPALCVVSHHRKTEELVRIVAKLAEVCGPLILWHDAGETPIVMYPTGHAEPGTPNRSVT
jgi:hypothetical protein